MFFHQFPRKACGCCMVAHLREASANLTLQLLKRPVVHNHRRHSLLYMIGRGDQCQYVGRTTKAMHGVVERVQQHHRNGVLKPGDFVAVCFEATAFWADRWSRENRTAQWLWRCGSTSDHELGLIAAFHPPNNSETAQLPAGTGRLAFSARLIEEYERAALKWADGLDEDETIGWLDTRVAPILDGIAARAVRPPQLSLFSAA